MKIYKIEAQGDTIYVEAVSREHAIDKMKVVTGPIPRSLLTVSEVPKLPKGEELFG